MTAISLSIAASATGALAQTYVAPGGSPIATAPGGSAAYAVPSPDGRYDRLTTGAIDGQPPALGAARGDRVRADRSGSRSPAR